MYLICISIYKKFYDYYIHLIFLQISIKNLRFFLKNNVNYIIKQNNLNFKSKNEILYFYKDISINNQK